MKSTKNRGQFPGRRGRPTKAALAALKQEKERLEAERKANLPVYPMLSYDQLREKFDVDLRTVDPATVTDINDISIPETDSPHEWLRSWITQTGNPFLIKVDGIVVQLSGNLDPLEGRVLPQKHGQHKTSRHK